MEKQNSNAFPIEEYVDIGLRRKWLIIVPIVLSMIITIIFYKKLPKIYRADTLILVLPQNVPEEYVRATVTASVEARLATITEEVLSRTRLETVIKEFDLYPEARQKLPMDRIVEMARGAIEIDVKKGRSLDKSSSFKIFYQGKEPETVRRVTNKLASLFIEENLKTREHQARVTTQFLQKELETAKERLEQQEKAITEFKFKHIGNLPEQNPANLEMLRQLAEQRQMINERIARAEEKGFLIQQQLSESGQLLGVGDTASLREQLLAAKSELLKIKSAYTENHIEVRKVQARIRQLEAQLISDGKDAHDQTHTDEQTVDPLAQDLKNQSMSVGREIERLKKEETRINQAISIYEKRLEEAPRVELQLATLTRDHDNTQQFYQELLRKKLEAEQAENLERRQQAEQFRILDPASLPKLPYKPDPKKVFPMGLLLGLGVGLGLVFLAETLDKSFRSEKEVEEYLGVPVLASIPLIKKEKKSHLIVHG